MNLVRSHHLLALEQSAFVIYVISLEPHIRNSWGICVKVHKLMDILRGHCNSSIWRFSGRLWPDNTSWLCSYGLKTEFTIPGWRTIPNSNLLLKFSNCICHFNIHSHTKRNLNYLLDQPNTVNLDQNNLDHSINQNFCDLLLKELIYTRCRRTQFSDLSHCWPECTAKKTQKTDSVDC